MTNAEAKNLFLAMSTEQKLEHLYRENERRYEAMILLLKMLGNRP